MSINNIKKTENKGNNLWKLTQNYNMIYSFLTYYYIFLVLDYLGQDDFFQVTAICLKISGCSCYKQLSPLYKCTIVYIHLILDISCKVNNHVTVHRPRESK